MKSNVNFGDERLPLRFWDKVALDPVSGCWLWTASTSNGYGYFYRGVGKGSARAHRHAYIEIVGDVPDGLCLDHLCRTRSCVNPGHLEAVSNRTNILRGDGHTALNAARTHCPQGHEYTPENTMVRVRSDHTARQCITCRRRNDERYRATRRDHGPA